MLRRLLIPFVALVVLTVSGCVSEPLEPAHQPSLGVIQSSDGSVVFSLDTEVGYKYQILYQDPSDQRWKPVKGCEAIIGTGKNIEIKKSFNSRRALPQFTVGYSKL